jgi:SNF2 family DNA or RNA helicase
MFVPRRVVERGMSVYDNRVVHIIKGDESLVTAIVRGSANYSVRLARQAKTVAASCTCPYFDTDGVCKHIWATLLEADGREYLSGDDNSSPTQIVASRIRARSGKREAADSEAPPAGSINSVKRTAVPRPPAPPPWQHQLSRLNFGRTAPMQQPWPSEREIYYVISASTQPLSSLAIRIMGRDRLANGSWGKLKEFSVPVRHIPRITSQVDREVLLTLAGSMQPSYISEVTIPATVYLQAAHANLLMEKICGTERCLLAENGRPETMDGILRWDDGEPWHLRLSFEQNGNKWRLTGCFRRDGEQLALPAVKMVCHAGILVANGLVAQVVSGDQIEWLTVIHPEPQVEFQENDLSRFLPDLAGVRSLPEVEWPAEWNLRENRPSPRPHLTVSQQSNGWQIAPPSVGTLSFAYGDHVAPFGKGPQCFYKPEDKTLLWRDLRAEAEAASQLEAAGGKLSESWGDAERRWQIGAKKLITVFSELSRKDWTIEVEGKPFRRGSSFEASLSSNIDWFDLDGFMTFGDQRLRLPELLKALQNNQNMVKLPDGSIGLLPEEFIEKYGMLARFAQTSTGSVRFSHGQAGLLDLLLAEQPEVRVDEVFSGIRHRLNQFEHLAPMEQPAAFQGTLRDYQRQGLGWLEFLRSIGLGGCLADDMGVGKTAQVLALLESRRASHGQNGSAQKRPSLVVAPRTLIYNWQQEAARFTPQLRVLDLSGADRRTAYEEIANCDVALTTYGTLRRDILQLREIRFHYAVLDEAQAIKNAQSNTAKAARLLNAEHRLALSGTPIENHLGELWSLFEFLNPGMLGASGALRTGSASLRTLETSQQQILSKALRPFILRRTKSQVARELPAKTEQTLYCELPGPQRKLYDELRDHYRKALLGKAGAQSMAKMRMRVLEALLRLRQAACHTGLIDEKRRGEPSAKLEALIPQLQEVISENHKVLVFSQFTSFLSIVREQLNQEGITHEYLDGQTSDRQACVERFQNDPECPAFLISLKAGGTGLNLTAADYVFLLDPWWNPAVEAQAVDRAHRIGQINSVFAYRLISRDTVEEKVLELQKQKRDLVDGIFGEENRYIGNLEREDLELLLS